MFIDVDPFDLPLVPSHFSSYMFNMHCKFTYTHKKKSHYIYTNR